MNAYSRITLAGALCLAVVSASAQFGPRPGAMGAGPQGPRLSGSTAKLFGDNTAFSANLEFQTKGADSGEAMTMPGKIAFDHGKSRFEMDMTQMKGGRMGADAAAHMKSMGMDKTIVISLPDKKASYLIYPGLQGYVENPAPDAKAEASPSDFKVETTELGKETVDGHPCIKNKTIVTDKDGAKHEATVWNATDLKNFPVKIDQTEQGTAVTMQFKDIKLAKPDASQFDVPSDCTKYDSMMSMMQQVMMKRMGGMNGLPPGRPPQGQ
jgi:hypothetical protein